MKVFRCFILTALLANPVTARATTAYDIDVKLNNSLSYDSIDLSINYSAANGDFTGTGSSVSCTPNASLNASQAFNEASPVLNAGAMSTTPITGPVVLFTCIFDSNSGAPSTGDFSISLRGWSSSSTSTAPTIQISRIALH